MNTIDNINTANVLHYTLYTQGDGSCILYLIKKLQVLVTLTI